VGDELKVSSAFETATWIDRSRAEARITDGAFFEEPRGGERPSDEA
jgi:hypothetical protein